ncbi:MAG: hypothetical protein JXB23_00670, partial [Candidatus Aminicenantes bacterium]|nr:hypothetical protein [Candidatus Aminicenantes bacterium]
VRKEEMGGRFRWITEKKDTEVESRSIKSESEPILEAFLPDKAGYYILKAESKDGRKNRITTSFSFYVTGRDYVPWKREDDDVIELISDQETYRPGDKARVLVKSPYESAQALVTLEREGVLESRVQEIVGSTSAIEVPIRSEHIPNVYVCVLLVQGRTSDSNADREQDLGKPSFKIGYVKLGVDPGEKKLSVSIGKDKETYVPGEKVSLKLKVRNAGGKEAASCLSVAVVDIGVLNLIGYRTPDLLSHFYSQRPLSVQTSETRHMVVGQRVFGEKGDEPAGGLGETAKAAAPLSLSEVELRGDFKFTAYWNPSVLTDEDGNADVEFTLPDNLTTFRVMAVAQTKDSEFGRSEEQFRVTKPLLLQPALPRFARIGDTFYGGVVVHNNSKQEGDVILDCDSVGLACLDKETVRRFSLASGEGKEILFAFSAEKRGTAGFGFRAKMGEISDGLEVSIPILVPRPTETVALHKDTLESADETIKIPENVYPELSLLSFQASASALSGLKGSLDFLKDYPYLCLEQRISAVLPFLVAADIIQDFRLTESTEAEIREFVTKNLKEIYSYQKGNGGFGLWPDSTYINPFNTCYAAFALYQAQRSGYKVDSQVVSRLLNYLRNLMSGKVEKGRERMQRGRVDQGRYPYGQRTWKTIEAYAAYCLALFGRAEAAFAEQLFTEREQLSLFGKTLLLKALFHGKGAAAAQRTLLQELINKIKVSPTSAHFEEDSGMDGRWIYSSNLRSSAYILQTLLELDTENPLIPAVARWLVDRRNAGQWLTTQENFYSFYALNDFYRKYEDIRPDFKVTVRLAGKTLMEDAFRQGKHTVRSSKSPLGDYAEGEALALKVEKEGRGRLYYETRMTYAPKTPLSARDEGFTVYKSITDFEGRPLKTIKAGDVVVVTLQVITPQERLFAVVDDPLPAGLEAVNPHFKIESSEQLRRTDAFEDNRGRWWEGFNHIEMHDDRVLLFADSLSAGIHLHRYLARALTYGTFQMPGTVIEEMYAPEVFGRSQEAVVTIKQEP